MIEKEDSDRKKERITLLAGISGHFEVISPKDERSIQSLQGTLTKVLYIEDITAVKNSFVSAANSYLFNSTRYQQIFDDLMRKGCGLVLACGYGDRF